MRDIDGEVDLIAYESAGEAIDPLLLRIAAVTADIAGGLPPAVRVADDVEAAIGGRHAAGGVLVVRAFAMTDGRATVDPTRLDVRIGWAPLSFDAAAREARQFVWSDCEPRRDPLRQAPRPGVTARDDDLCRCLSTIRAKTPREGTP